MRIRPIGALCAVLLLAMVSAWAGDPVSLDNVRDLELQVTFDAGLRHFDVHSLDGDRLAVSGMGQFIVWDLASPAPTRSESHDGEIICLSPIRSQMAVFARSREVEIWTVDPLVFRLSLGSLQGMSKTNGAFTLDGETFAVVNRWNEVDVWDVARGERIHTLTGLRSNVFDLAFSSDGLLLAGAGGFSSRDDQGVSLVCVWDVASGELLQSLPTDDVGDNHTILFAQEDARLITTGHRRVLAWDTTSWERVSDGGAHPGSYGISLSPDGQLLALASDMQTVLVLDVRNLRSARILPVLGAVHDVSFSPDGTKLVAACADGNIRIWLIP